MFYMTLYTSEEVKKLGLDKSPDYDIGGNKMLYKHMTIDNSNNSIAMEVLRGDEKGVYFLNSDDWNRYIPYKCIKAIRENDQIIPTWYDVQSTGSKLYCSKNMKAFYFINGNYYKEDNYDTTYIVSQPLTKCTGGSKGYNVTKGLITNGFKNMHFLEYREAPRDFLMCFFSYKNPLPANYTVYNCEVGKTDVYTYYVSPIDKIAVRARTNKKSALKTVLPKTIYAIINKPHFQIPSKEGGNKRINEILSVLSTKSTKGSYTKAVPSKTASHFIQKADSLVELDLGISTDEISIGDFLRAGDS